ncbi:hypothetical protein KHC28_00180 [Ancylobacter sonchi]|uniref:hypothetical protein n=1 Tax=Ancylobacter sonchi TaxID=1937790 RepID=UPI001BD61D51|nr:hypothetical protein [Ancylobacter sonchi]MBS7532081.1 hypothetical protein [Ancylobacter sonchi]
MKAHILAAAETLLDVLIACGGLLLCDAFGWLNFTTGDVALFVATGALFRVYKLKRGIRP